jgi:hypothetical protein
MIVLDTNILVYAHDDRDPRKRSVALQLINTARPLALPWQALGMAREKAWQFIESLQKTAEAILIPDPALSQPGANICSVFLGRADRRSMPGCQCADTLFCRFGCPRKDDSRLKADQSIHIGKAPIHISNIATTSAAPAAKNSVTLMISRKMVAHPMRIENPPTIRFIVN